MLKAHLRLADLGGTWRNDGMRWTSGRSWIEPFANPALEVVAAVDETTTMLVIRERATNRASEPLAVGPAELRTSLDTWPADFLTMEIVSGQMTITVGTRGVAPVYLASSTGALDLSWWLPDLRPHLTASQIDRTAALRFITGQFIYSHTTLWPNVFQLTERLQAQWTRAGLTIQLPEEAAHFRARTVADGADPITAYSALVDGELDRRQLPADATFVEISGGLDSANVALSARKVLPGTRAYGLLITGPAASQQRQRRQLLLDRLGMPDLSVEALLYAPFSGHMHTGQFVDPLVEPYRECLDAVAAQAAAAGGRIVLTGIGGDELMYLYPDERGTARPVDSLVWPLLAAGLRDEIDTFPSRALPATAVYEPTLLAAAARAPIFLRRGLWPVNLLAAPDIVRFCEWLPVPWRADRRLHRERLVRAGLPPNWTRPAVRENFAAVMAHGLRKHVLPRLEMLMADPLLAQLGLIDPSAVRAQGKRIDTGEPPARGLYEVVTLELALQSLVN